MPPSFALGFCLLLIFWLFWRDSREDSPVTAAMWLPFFWAFIGGSRFTSEWFNLSGLSFGGGSVEEGSPLDATVFFILIATGIYVLYKRRFGLGNFIRQNRWVTLYLAYCLLSVAWSDFPFVALKRYFKLFGQPVLALVILTEPDPLKSLIWLMKKLAYVFIPLSIVFIKYFPEWGRTFDAWSGLPTNSGVTTNKNSLGFDCFILGFFLVWYFIHLWHGERGQSRKREITFCAIFGAMNGWLLYMAHSATSLGVLVLGVAVMLLLGIKTIDRRRVGSYVFFGLMIFVVAEGIFGIHNYIFEALGRNSTLTDRTKIWQILLNWDINPIWGTGFESFWLGDRVNQFAAKFHGIMINEAHNGYLETYIQIGLLGIVFTLAMLLAAYFKTIRALVTDLDFGKFRLAYLFAFVAYNWTEAAFRTHCLPFFLFFIIAIDYNNNRKIFEPNASELESYQSPDRQ